MNNSIYLIGYNQPGYMPDNQPECYESLDHAKDGLVFLIENYIDEIESDAFSPAEEDRLKQAKDTLQEFKEAKAQECNVYIADYVFWITTN